MTTHVEKLLTMTSVYDRGDWRPFHFIVLAYLDRFGEVTSADIAGRESDRCVRLGLITRDLASIHINTGRVKSAIQKMCNHGLRQYIHSEKRAGVVHYRLTGTTSMDNIISHLVGPGREIMETWNEFVDIITGQ